MPVLENGLRAKNLTEVIAIDRKQFEA